MKRITGTGTIAGLLDVIGHELMAGCGIRFATNDYGREPPCSYYF